MLICFLAFAFVKKQYLIMEYILKYLELNNTEIALIACLFIFFIIQIFYYRYYYNRPILFHAKTNDSNTENQPGVSLIIVAKENSVALEQSLPAILNQKYPNYEVIIVNIGFTEETHNLIQSLKLKHSNLYDTFLPYEPLEKNTDRRKIALTLGIKAAKNDILLFTEPDTAPDSENWIASMMSHMTEDKDVVIGYSYYNKIKSLWGRVARFDNLIHSLQYLSSAILRKPYTGVYRNLAYRKELFFNSKGFSSSLNYEHSEGIFLNRLMNKQNVAIALDKDSFVSTDLNNCTKWCSNKLYFYKIKKHFSNFKFQANQFAIEGISRYLFYISFGLLLSLSIVNQNWLVLSFAALLLIVKLIVQLVTINKSAKYFESGKYIFVFIIVELLQPIYNLYFKALASKKRSKL